LDRTSFRDFGVGYDQEIETHPTRKGWIKAFRLKKPVVETPLESVSVESGQKGKESEEVEEDEDSSEGSSEESSSRSSSLKEKKKKEKEKSKKQKGEGKSQPTQKRKLEKDKGKEKEKKKEKEKEKAKKKRRSSLGALVGKEKTANDSRNFSEATKVPSILFHPTHHEGRPNPFVPTGWFQENLAGLSKKEEKREEGEKNHQEVSFQEASPSPEYWVTASREERKISQIERLRGCPRF